MDLGCLQGASEALAAGSVLPLSGGHLQLVQELAMVYTCYLCGELPQDSHT